jgi:DNA-directed RNA polymerase subunit RPC12/RpoP
MPATKQDKVLVACPHCGHQQPEPRAAFSTNCKKCGQHFHVQEALNPPRKTPESALKRRRVICFECGAELDVPASAESTMCKRCSRYVDLHNYRITNAVAKHFKTKGAFVIEPKGCVFNSETIAGDISIKGQFHGKLTAERSLGLPQRRFGGNCRRIGCEYARRWNHNAEIQRANVWRLGGRQPGYRRRRGGRWKNADRVEGRK